MKTITGLLLTGVMAVPAAPAAAQDRNWQRDLDHLADYAILLAADVLNDIADARLQSAGDRERERQRVQDRVREEQRRVEDRQRGRDRYPEYTESFSRTVKVGRNGHLELENLSGDVEITGGGGDEVRITATKKAHAPTESAARETLRATEIQVTSRPGSVSIKAEATRGRQDLAEVDYVISVPASTELMIRTISGDIRVKNIESDVRLQATSGDVTVTAVKARDLEVETISGDITIDQVDSERLNTNVISGDIEYRGKLARNGRYDFRSHSGDIRIVPDGPSGFSIDASTFSGDFTSDYALKLEGGTGLGNGFGKGRGRGLPGLPGTRGTIHGTFNDGGAVLSVRSFSGDIVITKK